MSLPTADDINVYDSLDERSALDHFLNKSVEEAEILFRENSLHYQEDLMWMRPKAFCFYVPAVINYIRSTHSTGDSDIVSCLHGLLEFRLKHDGSKINAVLSQLKSVIEYIIANWDTFDVNISIYGDLKAKYRHLLTYIESRC